MSKRALRRHHRARMVEKAKKITRRWWNSYEPSQEVRVPGHGYVHERRPVDHTKPDEAARRVADHLAQCSCYSCGNPRRHHGFSVQSGSSEALTMQERRSLIDMKEWEEELENDLIEKPFM